MIKKSISYPFVYFVVLTVWQYITNKEVDWIQNISISLIMFLIFLAYYWSKVPYKWKKDKGE